MKIDFFTTNRGMDKRAVRGGVYHVELLKDDMDQPISLYIGESAWIVASCGEHLYYFNDNPHYFGLTKIDLENDELTLRFSVLETVEEKKSVLSRRKYKDRELFYIQKEKPATQLETSDRQIRDVNEKIRRVQDSMRKLGFI